MKEFLAIPAFLVSLVGTACLTRVETEKPVYSDCGVPEASFTKGQAWETIGKDWCAMKLKCLGGSFRPEVCMVTYGNTGDTEPSSCSREMAAMCVKELKFGACGDSRPTCDECGFGRPYDD